MDFFRILGRGPTRPLDSKPILAVMSFSPSTEAAVPALVLRSQSVQASLHEGYSADLKHKQNTLLDTDVSQNLRRLQTITILKSSKIHVFLKNFG